MPNIEIIKNITEQFTLNKRVKQIGKWEHHNLFNLLVEIYETAKQHISNNEKQNEQQTSNIVNTQMHYT